MRLLLLCARWNGEVPGGNAGSLKLPAAADSCKTFVVGAGGKFPGREKIGISQQSTRPVGRNFLGPDFRETPGFIRQKENSYLKARWEIPMNDGGQLPYREVFSIFWKRFNMFFLITKPGGNEGKQAKTQTNPAEMPEDRRRWGRIHSLFLIIRGVVGELGPVHGGTSREEDNIVRDVTGLCMSGTPLAAKKPTGWPFPAWNPAF